MKKQRLLRHGLPGRLAAVLLLLVAAAAPHVMPRAVQAQAPQEDAGRESITLSPVNKRYTVSPGQVVKDELTVINDGTSGYDFIVYGRPYSIKDESYDPDFNATPPNADAFGWVQFQKTNWRLEAGQSVKVPYTMRVPENAAPGGHYGVLFAETQPEVTDADSVVRKKRVGSILYATVEGEYRTGGSVTGTSIPFLQFRAPLSATLTVENTGNADFIVDTAYRVSDLFGNIKYQSSRPYTVLPETSRRITLEWQQSDGAPWFGLYKVETAAKFLDQSSANSGYVLMVPRWLLIVFMALIAGGAIYAVLHVHRRRRAKRRAS